MTSETEKAASSDRRGRGMGRSGSAWGLRASPNVMRRVASLLDDTNPRSLGWLAEQLQTKKTTPDLALVTLNHLGFTRRTPGGAVLTPTGLVWVRSIGNAAEPDNLCRALLAERHFSSMWSEISSRLSEVGRKETSTFVDEKYNYSKETSEAIATNVLSLAVEARLCTRIGTSNRYVIDKGRIKQFEAEEAPVPARYRGVAPKTAREAQVSAEQRTIHHLIDLSARLASPLADSNLLSDKLVRAPIASGFQQALKESPGAGWSTLIRLAEDLTQESFESNNREPLRRAVILLRGTLQAMTEGTTAPWDGKTPLV